MADKSISELTQATQITNEDMFVLQQGTEAKKLLGATLLDFLTLSVVKVTVTTLPAGSAATATYDKTTGTLALGIPQGDKGDTGDKGKTGDKGDTGPANTLSIGTVTSGDTASVTITGDSPKQVLNFVLQKGDKGTKGDVGPANTLSIGSVTSGETPSANITGTAPNQELNLVLPQGNPGADAPTITGITVRQSDYHLIVSLSDGTSYDAGYCRGQAGAGSGDMLASTYDKNGKRTDIYQYVDDEIAKIPTPDVSAQISAHNTSTDAHSDIRTAVDGKLGTSGDGSSVTAKFTAATTRANIATGEKLSVLFGKIAKWFSDLGTLAWQSSVAKTDLASDVQTSLGKADSALQSYTETDPTVPDWAKAESKPSYTASEVGALPDTTVIPSVPSTTALLKGNGSGGMVAATKDTDYASPVVMRKVTLTVAGWSSTTKQQAVTVTGVLADTTKQEIRPAPVDTSYDSAWNSCAVLCVAQAANSLTFQCETVPTAAIEVYVSIRTVQYAT